MILFFLKYRSSTDQVTVGVGIIYAQSWTPKSRAEESVDDEMVRDPSEGDAGIHIHGYVP